MIKKRMVGFRRINGLSKEPEFLKLCSGSFLSSNLRVSLRICKLKERRLFYLNQSRLAFCHPYGDTSQAAGLMGTACKEKAEPPPPQTCFSLTVNLLLKWTVFLASLIAKAERWSHTHCYNRCCICSLTSLSHCCTIPGLPGGTFHRTDGHWRFYSTEYSVYLETKPHRQLVGKQSTWIGNAKLLYLSWKPFWNMDIGKQYFKFC